MPSKLLCTYLATTFEVPYKSLIDDFYEAGINFNVLNVLSGSQIDLHPIFDSFKLDKSFIVELSGLVTAENLFLVCYLCEQHDVDASVPALIYLTRKVPKGVVELVDRDTVRAIVSVAL